MITAAADPPALSFHTITNDDRGEPHRRNRDISSWTYEEEPWLTDANLVAWNLDTGRLFLNQEKAGLLGRFDPSFAGVGRFPYPYKLFLVLAEGEPCFVGSFHSMLSSLGPVFPFFGDTDIHMAPPDVIHLRPGWNSTDVQDNPCLREALRQAGLYPAALSTEVQAVRVSDAEAPPGSRIECDILLANPGPDPLVILDPGLMDQDFNVYRARVSIWSPEPFESLVDEKIKQPEGSASLGDEWLTVLPAGGTLTATLVRKVERLPSGHFRCRVDYPGLSGLTEYDTDFGGKKVFYGEARSPEFEIEID
jgi:hypothetical protein